MYESVDDESLENFSTDSLDSSENSLEEVKSSGVAIGKPTRSCVSFRLHDEGQTGRGPSESKRGTGDTDKLPWNCEIDETALSKKGLQLNKDGSFSKSPREEVDLPFVMPAPRVALIMRRKREGRKNSQASTNFVDADGIGRGGNLLRKLSRLKANGNLTDSMKEALRNKCEEPDDAGNDDSIAENLLRKYRKELIGNKKGEISVRMSKKNRSELHLPTIEKPMKLSYFERYQKKIGFDPRSIVLKGGRPIEDTVRSRFGDSFRESLSDVSSRVVPIEEDEEEELFYRRMMMEEEEGGLQDGTSTRDYSGRSFGETRTKKSVERKKEVKIGKAARRSGKESNPGALPPKCVLSENKSGHFCNQGLLPKAELASKARAYGNLANTRNIVKMQLKSFRRDWELTREYNPRPGFESFLSSLKDSPKGRKKVI